MILFSALMFACSDEEEVVDSAQEEVIDSAQEESELEDTSTESEEAEE